MVANEQMKRCSAPLEKGGWRPLGDIPLSLLEQQKDKQQCWRGCGEPDLSTRPMGMSEFGCFFLKN